MGVAEVVDDLRYRVSNATPWGTAWFVVETVLSPAVVIRLAVYWLVDFARASWRGDVEDGSAPAIRWRYTLEAPVDGITGPWDRRLRAWLTALVGVGAMPPTFLALDPRVVRYSDTEMYRTMWTAGEPWAWLYLAAIAAALMLDPVLAELDLNRGGDGR